MNINRKDISFFDLWDLKRTVPMPGFKNFHSSFGHYHGNRKHKNDLTKGQITGQTLNQNTFQNFVDLMA